MRWRRPFTHLSRASALSLTFVIWCFIPIITEVWYFHYLARLFSYVRNVVFYTYNYRGLVIWFYHGLQVKSPYLCCTIRWPRHVCDLVSAWKNKDKGQSHIFSTTTSSSFHSCLKTKCPAMRFFQVQVQNVEGEMIPLSEQRSDEASRPKSRMLIIWSEMTFRRMQYNLKYVVLSYFLFQHSFILSSGSFRDPYPNPPGLFDKRFSSGGPWHSCHEIIWVTVRRCSRGGSSTQGTLHLSECERCCSKIP